MQGALADLHRIFIYKLSNLIILFVYINPGRMISRTVAGTATTLVGISMTLPIGIVLALEQAMSEKNISLY